MVSRHVLQNELSPADVGIDGVAGDVTKDSAWITSSGYSQATLLINYVKVGSHTPTNVTFNIETSPNGGVTTYLLQGGAVATGVVTLSPLQYLKATGGGSTAYVVDLPVNYEQFRIKSLAVGLGIAADSFSVTVRLGVL